MGEFAPFVSDDCDRLEFPEGNWVDIKKEMTWDDHQQIRSIYVVAGIQHAGSKNKAKISDGEWEAMVAKANRLSLLLSIKAWSFKDKGGKVKAVNMENIKRLPKSIGDRIAKEINDRNPFDPNEMRQ